MIVANARDTKMGRITVMALKEEAELPRLEMTCTIIKPTTSSSIAALDKMIPRRLPDKPLVVRIVKVVPSEVEHSAAPAAKAWRDVMSSSFFRVKDRAMGETIPVRATRTDR